MSAPLPMTLPEGYEPAHPWPEFAVGPVVFHVDDSGRPQIPPVVQTCGIGSPACGLPAEFSIEVAGLARSHDRPVVPTLTGILWVCDFHSGIAMEEWS